MLRLSEGWFELTVSDAQHGAIYNFVLESGKVVPDPAAREQEGCVHGPSKLAGPGTYHWEHSHWRGRAWAEAVFMEIHVGTFTPEGTFRAAIGRLKHLASIGITAIEIMPVAQFPGTRGWGYDGVLLYAPHPAYGEPDDLKAFIDAAHGLGLMVFLDVVFNHFGPAGSYMESYADAFFHPDRHTPWGRAIAYERLPVRGFFIENALHWLGEFRFDGLRFDAVDYVCDPDSPVEILVEIAETVRAAFPERLIHLTTEDNRNITQLHERATCGDVVLYTAEWNDDFHNAAHVIATGEIEGYYVDFARGRWQRFARLLAEGFGYQGQVSIHEGNVPRGTPSNHLPPLAFVDFLQNHDQIGNRAFGERLTTLARPEILRALQVILLLSPHVPLLFMGEEWCETRPFAFFCDFEGELAEKIRDGRRKEFGNFSAFQDPAIRSEIPDPNDLSSFTASKLDWTALETSFGREALAFMRGLLAIRHREIVPRLAGARGHCGEVIKNRDGIIAVDWRLDGAMLKLRANLDDRPRKVPTGGGKVIHGPDGDDLELPAFTVRLLIDAFRA